MMQVDLSIAGQPIGQMTIGRLVVLDLSDKDAIADHVSPYRVRVDGKVAGDIEHRYGDGAWVLLRKALELHMAKQR